MNQLQRERQILNETKRFILRDGDPSIEKLFKPGFWFAGIFTNIRYLRLDGNRIRVEYVYSYEKYSAILSINSIMDQINVSHNKKTESKAPAPRFTNSIKL